MRRDHAWTGPFHINSRVLVSCYSSEIVASPLISGARIDSYKILDALGAGGMGEVYRARDSRLGRDVALKVLREDGRFDPERRARFEREARAAAALTHPNIVSIFDIGEHDGSLYIVSELIAGETHRCLLRGGPLPTRKLLDIAVQIADGLAAAHAAGITHRDLKPENIMVRPERRGKNPRLRSRACFRRFVCIFRGDTHCCDRPGKIVGTVNYMSPEQARGMAVTLVRTSSASASSCTSSPGGNMLLAARRVWKR